MYEVSVEVSSADDVWALIKQLERSDGRISITQDGKPVTRNEVERTVIRETLDLDPS